MKLQNPKMVLAFNWNISMSALKLLQNYGESALKVPRNCSVRKRNAVNWRERRHVHLCKANGMRTRTPWEMYFLVRFSCPARQLLIWKTNVKEVDARRLRTTPLRLMIRLSLFICIVVASAFQRSPYPVEITSAYSNTCDRSSHPNSKSLWPLHHHIVHPMWTLIAILPAHLL